MLFLASINKTLLMIYWLLKELSSLFKSIIKDCCTAVINFRRNTVALIKLLKMYLLPVYKTSNYDPSILEDKLLSYISLSFNVSMNGQTTYIPILPAIRAKYQYKAMMSIQLHAFPERLCVSNLLFILGVPHRYKPPSLPKPQHKETQKESIALNRSLINPKICTNKLAIRASIAAHHLTDTSDTYHTVRSRTNPLSKSTLLKPVGAVSNVKLYQKLLALDLDGTLIYASGTVEQYRVPDYTEIIPTLTGTKLYSVWERPHLQLFLTIVSKWYNVCIYTASVPTYAEIILNRIEGSKRRVKQLYCREYCVPKFNANKSSVYYYKDLDRIGHSPSASILIDDTPDISVSTTTARPIIIPSYKPETKTNTALVDRTLLDLLPLLEALYYVKDVRSVLAN